jgi:hypothetical protein
MAKKFVYIFFAALLFFPNGAIAEGKSPRALQGVDLAEAQKVSDEEAGEIRGGPRGKFGAGQ